MRSNLAARNATKSFSDFNGTSVELAAIWSMDNPKFAAAFPGIKGCRYDSFSMQVGVPAGVILADRNALPVTRKVNYKKFGSKHVCDARCMGATGRTMNCECSCGGVNHGRGFLAEEI
jgi:hypothetical protein